MYTYEEDAALWWRSWKVLVTNISVYLSYFFVTLRAFKT